MGHPKMKQLVSALIVAFGGVGFGISVSWTATALPSITETQQVGHDLTNMEKSLIGSLLTLGSLVACPITAYTMNQFGRKASLFYICIIAIPGWILLAAGTSSVYLYVGRILTGIYVGGCTVVIPVYVKEISDESNRGALGSLFLIMLSVGKLISNGLGIIFNANFAALICTLQPILHAFLLLFIPDSPWSKTKNASTEIGLQKISGHSSGKASSSIELDIEPVNPPSSNQLQSIISVFVLTLLAQFSGINVATFFTNEMFQESSVNHINSNFGLVLLSAIQVIGGFPASFFVEKYGRKSLILWSLYAMSFALAILSAYYYCIGHYNFNEFIGCYYEKMTTLIPLIFLSLYVLSYSWGIGSVIWIVMSEIIPPQSTAFVTSVANAIYWTSAFLVTMLYQLFSEDVPLYLWFAGFLATCIVGIFYIITFLPETKGLTFNRVENH